MSLVYLDSSAFVKMIVDEPESARLEDWLEGWPQRASSALLRTEAVRALTPYGPDAIASARAGFRRLHLIRLDDRLLDEAGGLSGGLRSLDAIHVAAARALGADLGAFVTYDRRMESVARALGLPVVSP